MHLPVVEQTQGLTLTMTSGVTSCNASTHSALRTKAWRENSSARNRRDMRAKARQRQFRPRRSYWNSLTGIFSADRFIVAHILKMPFHVLASRQDPARVHNPFNLKLPTSVLSFLGKSEKLVPTTKPPSYIELDAAFMNFTDSIKKHIAFAGLPQHHRCEPMPYLRKRFFNHSRPFDDVKYGSKLPRTLGPELQKMCGELMHNLYNVKSHTRQRSLNLDFSDAFAVSWLRNNIDFCIDTPADKNLGSVILPTSTYN